MKKIFRWYLLSLLFIVHTNGSAQTDLPKDIDDFCRDLLVAFENDDYEIFVDRRLLDTTIIKDLNMNSEKPMMIHTLSYKIKHLTLKTEDKLQEFRREGVRQGINWSNIEVLDIDYFKKLGKGEILFNVSSNNKYFAFKIYDIETITGKFKLGLKTEYFYKCTKSQLSEAKGVIKTIYTSLRTNSYSNVHEGNLMTMEDMRYMMEASGQYKKLGLSNPDIKLNQARIEAIKAEKDKYAKEFRLKYIKGLVSSIQKYHSLGENMDINWANTKVVSVDLDLKLKQRYGINATDVKFVFTDGKKNYATWIKDCFIINGHLRLGFNIKIEELEPAAILVSKMYESIKSNNHNQILETLIPGQEILREIATSDLRRLIPQDLGMNTQKARVYFIDKIRRELMEVIADGKLNQIEWTKVQLEDEHYGMKKVKINDRLELISITFDLVQGNHKYSIAIENCVLHKEKVYVLSNLTYISQHNR